MIYTVNDICHTCLTVKLRKCYYCFSDNYFTGIERFQSIYTKGSVTRGHRQYKVQLVSSCSQFYLLVDQEDVGVIRQLDPTAKEVTYNPRYEEMFTPQVTQNLKFFTLY